MNWIRTTYLKILFFLFSETAPDEQADSDSPADYLHRELKAKRPLRAALLSKEHCEKIVEAMGSQCQNIAGYRNVQAENAPTYANALYHGNPTPVGISPFIWIMLGKLAIELLIWYFTKQSQTNNAE